MDKQASRSNNEKAFVSIVARIILSKTGETASDSSSLRKSFLYNLFHLARCFILLKLIAIALVYWYFLFSGKT